MFYYRGQQFRTEFANISEVRSLLPKNTNLMALTATANLKTREMVVKSLDMKGCFVLSQNPNKTNIYYEVVKKTDMDTVIRPIVEHVSIRKKEADRHIIFCRTLGDCSDFFENITLALAENNCLLYDEHLKVHICEKFSACSSRVQLMGQFCDQDIRTPTYLHLCCDICASLCMCENCASLTQEHPEQHTTESKPLNLAIKKKLKEQLLLHKQRMWANIPPETALIGQDICTGVTRQTVEAIVNSYSEIKCEHDLLVLGVSHVVYCGPILEILKKYTK